MQRSYGGLLVRVPVMNQCIERTAIEDKKNQLRKPYAIAIFTKNILKFFQNAFSGMFIFTHRELLISPQKNSLRYRNFSC